MRTSLLVLAVSTMIVVGCAPPAVEGPAPSEELRAAQGTAWLVRRISFSRPVSGIAHGYDVDGVDSGDEPRGSGCVDSAPDYASALHPSLTGIDDAGADLISTAESTFGFSFAGELDGAVAEQRLRWAIRIGSLSSDDSTLPIDLVEIDPDPAIVLDSGGLPAAGQSLRGSVITTSLATPEDSSAAGLATVHGLPVDGDVTLLPFSDFRLAGMVLDASVAESGTLFVDLGGSFSVEGLMLETMRVVMDPDGDFTFARMIYESVADLEPSEPGSSTCARISVGFALEAVPMELTIH